MMSSSSSTSNLSNTSHEVARERTKIKDAWKGLELERAELTLMRDLVGLDMAVPQVRAMVVKLGRARKSKKRGGAGILSF